METWTIIENNLVKEFSYKNFIESVRFIDAIAEVAEKHNHHPDILLHDYKKVKIMLFTHSENKITDKDYALAKAIDELA